MGRKAKNPDRAGVTVTLSRPLLDSVHQAAELHGGDRSHVIELLLWRGLAARQTSFERFDAAMRAALRPARRA